MTFVIGQKAANRKLPADDILKADIAAGLTTTEMARKYGVHFASVAEHIKRNSLRPVAATVIAKPAPPQLCETRDKIIIRKEALVQGRDFQMVKIAISLPRIPTIHGHFQGAL